MRPLIALAFSVFLAADTSAQAELGPAPAPAPAPAAGALVDSAALRRRCEELVKATDKKIFSKGAFREMRAHVSEEPKRRCHLFGDSIFALLPTAFGQDEGNYKWTTDWALYRLDGAGGSTRIGGSAGSPAGPRRSQPKLPKLRDVMAAGDDSERFTIPQIFDLDGDGNPEVMLELEDLGYEVEPRKSVEIWSIKGGAFVRYPRDPKLPPQVGAERSLVADVDQDGRPDLYTSGPYSAVNRWVCGPGYDEQYVPAKFVVHSLPDGTFSDSDAIAKQVLRGWCPEPPNIKALFAAARGTEFKGLPVDDDVVHATICARVWGKSAQAVLSELAPECHKLGEDCRKPRNPPACPEWLEKLVAVQPPIQLR